jgi:anti-sigma-K factor RskA
MSAPLTRDEAFAMLPELALGMLPADDAARVMDVVRTSADCQAELASLRAAAGALDATVPANVMAPARKSAMRDRLLSRAAATTISTTISTTVSTTISDATGSAEPESIATAPRTPAVEGPAEPVPSLRLERRTPKPPRQELIAPSRSNPVSRFVPWFAAAASIGLALAQVQSARTAQSERDAARDALKAATVATTQLTAQLASSDSLVAAMTGAQVSVVELVSTAKLPPGARMFWDRLTNRWTLITHDLSPAQPGRVYQLWLVTAKAEKISAGTFNTDAQGRAVVQATYALAEADLAAIAITEEPEGGSPQPTGTILVAGAPTR